MRVIRGLLQQKRISSHSLAGVDFASQASQTPKTRSFACCQKSSLLCLWSALSIPALSLVFRCATGCRVEQGRPSGCSVWQHVCMQVRILSISFANLCVLKRSLFSRLGRVTDMGHGVIVMDSMPGPCSCVAGQVLCLWVTISLRASSTGLQHVRHVSCFKPGRGKPRHSRGVPS